MWKRNHLTPAEKQHHEEWLADQKDKDRNYALSYKRYQLDAQKTSKSGGAKPMKHNEYKQLYKDATYSQDPIDKSMGKAPNVPLAVQKDAADAIAILKEK